jgi:O-antigen ligase
MIGEDGLVAGHNYKPTINLVKDSHLNIRTDQLVQALLAGIPFLLVYMAAVFYWGPFIGLGLFAGLALALFIFQRPIFGLLFCLLIIFSGFVWGLGIKQGFLPVAIFSMAAVVTRKLYTLDFTFVNDRQLTYILAFFGFALLSVLGALYPLEAFKYLIVYGKLFIFYFLVINVIETKQHIWACTLTIIFSNLGSVLYGFYSLFFAPHSTGEMMVKARMRGLTDDPNIMAMEIVFIIPPLLLLIFHEGWKLRSFLYLLGVGALLAGLVASFSRGGTIALGIVFAIVLYHKRSWPLFILTLSIALVLVVFVIPPTFWEHLLTLFDLGKFLADPSLRWRGRLMMGAIDLFTQHPVFGIGIGNWMLIASRYMSLRSLAVHNTFLHVAAETGIFGILFFLMIFFRTFTNFSNAHRFFRQSGEVRLALLSQGFHIGLVGVFVGSVFLSVQEAFVIWAIFGFSVAMRHVADCQFQKGTPSTNLLEN